MKNAFEPIVLAVCLALLALVAAGLAYTFPKSADLQTASGVPSLDPQGKRPVALKSDVLQQELVPWSNPQTWSVPANGHRLFLSDRYLFYAALYPSGNYIQKDDGTATTPGGVLISWLRKYHLDITDVAVDRQDPDKDGFSNKAEFFNGAPANSKPDGSKSTNPLDPESHPTYLSQLRLEKFDLRPFHIEFMGQVSLGGRDVFQIKLSDLNVNVLKHSGEDLGYEGWKVGPYTKNIVTKEDPGTHSPVTEDDSTLELDKPDIGRKVLLPLRKVINSEESTASFVMLMPSENGKEIKVPSGKTFRLPMGPATPYMLLRVDDTGATLRDTLNKQEIHIPKLDPAEWNDVPAPAGASNTTPGSAPATPPTAASGANSR